MNLQLSLKHGHACILSEHTFFLLSSFSKRYFGVNGAPARMHACKVVERDGVYDQLDFLKQLGVIEYKGFPDEAT